MSAWILNLLSWEDTGKIQQGPTEGWVQEEMHLIKPLHKLTWFLGIWFIYLFPPLPGLIKVQAVSLGYLSDGTRAPPTASRPLPFPNPLHLLGRLFVNSFYCLVSLVRLHRTGRRKCASSEKNIKFRKKVIVVHYPRWHVEFCAARLLNIAFRDGLIKKIFHECHQSSNRGIRSHCLVRLFLAAFRRNTS